MFRRNQLIHYIFKQHGLTLRKSKAVTILFEEVPAQVISNMYNFLTSFYQMGKGIILKTIVVYKSIIGYSSQYAQCIAEEPEAGIFEVSRVVDVLKSY